MIDYQKTFLAFLHENNIPCSETFLIGVSGGVDSMSLLHLSQTCGLKVIAAHVNYQLREKESDLDEELVFDYCNTNNIELFTKRVDISKNIQVEAREVRYTFFHQIAYQKKCNYIITAHHQNDDHETFLLHLIRGSGIKGLKGIPKKRSIIIRPGMCFNKKQLLDYARVNQVPYREDHSNHEVKYDRNFLRNNVLNPIYKRFGKAETGITQSMQYIKEDYILLEDLINEKIEKYIEYDDEDIKIHHDKSINPLCYIHYIKAFGFNHDQAENWVSNPKQSGKIMVSAEFQITQDRNTWIISKRLKKKERKAEISNDCKMIKDPLGLSFHFSAIIPKEFKKTNNVVFLDADKISFPLTVRLWEHGDKIRPLGMKGSKKISDILIDNKTPLIEKEKTYVVTSNGHIIWLIGYTMNDLFKINDSTKRVYKIEHISN